MADEPKKHKKTERVMVHCRVRPLNDEDLRNYGKDVIIDSVDQHRGTVSLKREFDRKCFTFDSVYDGSSSQKDIYSKVADPVVNSVMQGYNGTIFAYGQTGTGKTFTMIGGTGESKGVIPRSISQIFLSIQQSPSHSFSIKIGFLQLYMEMLQDLLSPDDNKTIKIRENADDGVYLTGVSWKTVSSVKQCMDWLAVGDRNRSTAFTSMNAHSSRSHAVYMVKIEKRVKYTPEQLEELEKKGEAPDQSMTKSTLYLVDLAGSERVSKSKATGSRLDEAKNINLALLALGNCIQALSDKKAKYVPFRDSKLTRLLEDSLGGNSKTSLVVTIGPSTAHVQESLSAMQFGQRAMKIENRPEKNIKVDYRALCSQLQAEVDKFNDGNNMFSIEKDQYLEEINSLKAQVEKLTSEKEQMELELQEYRKGHNDLSKFEEVKKSELQRLQSLFKAKLEKKDSEHKKLLDQIDEVMLSREEELKREKNNSTELRNKVSYLTNEMKTLKEELEQEKTDRQVRIAQLVTEIDEFKQKAHQEKAKFSELAEEQKTFEDVKRLQQATITELNENYKSTVSKYSQETDSLNKELQKAQAANEKLKAQIQVKVNEFKESQAQGEHKWQEVLKSKEKLFNDRVKLLESRLNEEALKVTQFEREKLAALDDLAAEKEKLAALTSKIEKLKESYEERIQDVASEVQGLEARNRELADGLRDSNSQLEQERAQRKEEGSSLAHELKSTKHKNAKLLKAYKDSEARAGAVASELEQAKAQNSELMMAVQKANSDKEEVLRELEEANVQIVNLNKDRSKLIAKAENLSKKTSTIAKMKDRLSSEAEVKQQELKILLERRENLEEELEGYRSQIDKLSNDLKIKAQALDESKATASSLASDLQKKEEKLENLLKKVSELEAKLSQTSEKLLKTKEKYENSQNDLVKSKNSLDSVLEKLKDLESKNLSLQSDLKLSRDSIEKSGKDLNRVKEELIKSTNEYEEQLSVQMKEKDQIQSKYSKLLEDFKSNETACHSLKNLLKQRNSELALIKEKTQEFESFFKGRVKLCNESMAMLDAKASLLATSQDTIKFFVMRLKESLRAKENQLEKMQNLSKKETLILAESHSREVMSIRQVNKEQIESIEEKYSQEIQELQSYYEDIIKKANLKTEKVQEDLKGFYMSQISQINLTNNKILEDLKTTQNKVNQEIRNSCENQLKEQKEDLESQIHLLKETIKRNNEKYSEELQKIKNDSEANLENLRQSDEDTLNAMLKAKQKELEMILNENRSLKMDYESTLDRQKTQSTNMKSHQLGLFEEINRSHQQEIEALNIETSNKLKRKDTEINDIKRKLREIVETNDENSKEVDELKALVDKLKGENKKLESESKKIDSAKKSLDENFKILNKKFEIEKSKASELETQNYELNEKSSKLLEDKTKLSSEIKKLTQHTKKLEEEMSQNLKTSTQSLDSELKSLKLQLSRHETEKEVRQTLQSVLTQVEKKSSQDQIQKSKQVSEAHALELQNLEKSHKKVLQSHKEDYSSYISHLILENLKSSLELSSLSQELSNLKNQRSSIKSHLSGDYSLSNFIKTCTKDSKKGANLFEFLNSLTSSYSSLQEKAAKSSSIQVFSLSKVAHEKFMPTCRSLSLKSEASRRLYEKPAVEIEKELGVTGQHKAMSQTDVLAKRVRDTEKNIQCSVFALVDQMILVIELQQLSASEIRYQMESRKRKVEPLVRVDELKALEVQIVSTRDRDEIEEVGKINDIKRLAESLSSNLTVLSAVYSYVFSRCVYLEYLAEERNELVSMMLSNMQLQRTFKVHDFKKPFKFGKDQIAEANEFLGRGKEAKAPKAAKAEDPEEEKRKINKLMHTRAGLQLMKRHFNEIDGSFSSICKRFMSSK